MNKAFSLTDMVVRPPSAGQAFELDIVSTLLIILLPSASAVEERLSLDFGD